MSKASFITSEIGFKLSTSFSAPKYAPAYHYILKSLGLLGILARLPGIFLYQGCARLSIYALMVGLYF